MGTTQVPKAAPDEPTLMVGTVSTQAINPLPYKNIAHDTKEDFQPVSLIAKAAEPPRACLQRGSMRGVEFPFIQRDTLRVDGPAVAAP
jgi:hypothetical protein